MSEDATFRLIDVRLDESAGRSRTPEAEHERAVAIFDLIEANSFRLVDGGGGPYKLVLAVQENRLLFDVRDEGEQPLKALILSLTPFRKVVKDYFEICESYYSAIRKLSPSQIEALDMGRRGLHNEGSEILRERLSGKVEVDFDTARRLFTLICALYARA
jgi:uncharacterized protein (UPF0262 family)